MSSHLNLPVHPGEEKCQKIKVSENKDDVRFPSLLQGFNRRWVGDNIEFVYIVHSAAGARWAVDDALSEVEPGEVRFISGGHCYEDFVFCKRTKAIIHCSGLLDAGKHETEGYYLSSGDTNWGAFVRLFRDYGKVLPSGSCYSVGLGGHIAGGGEGILSRKHGLVVDWLTGVEVIVKPDANKPAEIKYVTPESPTQEEKDLFWAHTGGGGGNFGLITKYFFKELPDSPKGGYATNIHFSWEDLNNQDDPVQCLADILNAYFDFALTCDRNTVGKFQIYHEAAGEFVMYLYSCYQNDKELLEAKRRHYEIERKLGEKLTPTIPKVPLGGHSSSPGFPLRTRNVNRDFSEFSKEETFNYPFYTLTQTINGSGANQHGKYKSAFMKSYFPRSQILTMYNWLSVYPPKWRTMIYPSDQLDRADLKQSLIQVDMFGGAINDVKCCDTASFQRDYYIKLQYQTYWGDANKEPGHLNWIQGFYKDMYKDTEGVPNPKTTVAKYKDLYQGCFYNYPDQDLNLWRNGKYGALELYFQDNLDRLIQVKKRWDKNDFFQHRQSIPPLTEQEWLEENKGRQQK